VELQAAEFGAAHSGGVKCHQDRAVAEVGSALDESCGLLGAEDRRQSSRRLGQRQVIALEGTSENLQIQEAKSAHLHHDAVGCQLLLFEKVDLVLPDMLNAELIGRAAEILRKLPDGANVSTCGSLRVVTALEFLEHLFS